MIDYAKGNTGFIPEIPSSTDLQFKGNNRIKRLLGATPYTAEWLKFYSAGETQYGAYYDTRGCTIFSATKVLEAVINYHLRMDFISPINRKWLQDNGYLQNLEIRLSDRFTYHMSGNDPELGNTPGRVWWSLRNDGAVPESKWSWDRGRDIPQIEKYIEWFNQEPMQNLKDLGLEFKKRFEVLYEQVEVKDFKEALGFSPIQVFISANCPFIKGVEQKCTENIGHAVSLTKITEVYRLFDSYILDETKEGQERFIRNVSLDYVFFPYGYMCSFTEKKNIKPIFTFTIPLSYGTRSPEVVKVQDMLKYEGFVKGDSTGFFGPITAKGVQKWQLAHGLTDFKDETDFKKIRWGEKSIKLANKLYL